MKKKTISLRFIITFIIVMLVAIILFTSTLLNYITVKKSVSKEVEDKAKLTSKQYSDEVKEWLNEEIGVLEEMSRTISVVNNFENSFIKNYLKKQGDEKGLTFYMSLVNGTYIGSDDWIPDSDYNTLETEWYKSAFDKKDTVIGNPYVDSATGNIIITISVPIKNSENTKAGTVLTLSLLFPLIKLSKPFQRPTVGRGALTPPLSRFFDRFFTGRCSPRRPEYSADGMRSSPLPCARCSRRAPERYPDRFRCRQRCRCPCGRRS